MTPALWLSLAAFLLACGCIWWAVRHDDPPTRWLSADTPADRPPVVSRPARPWDQPAPKGFETHAYQAEHHGTVASFVRRQSSGRDAW